MRFFTHSVQRVRKDQVAQTWDSVRMHTVLVGEYKANVNTNLQFLRLGVSSIARLSSAIRFLIKNPSD